jgi:hypothetical protein
MAAGEKLHASNLKLGGYLKLLDNPIFLGLSDNAYISTILSSSSLDISNLSGDIDINANNVYLNTSLISSPGLFKYQGQYHGSYDNRTLVDKEYVDIQISLVGVSYWDLNTPGELVLNLGVPGPVLPHTTNLIDLGSTTYRWKDFFIGNSINLDSTATINAASGTSYLSLSYFGTNDFISLGVDSANALSIYKAPLISGSYTALIGENTLGLYAANSMVMLKALAAYANIGSGVDADIIITDGTTVLSHDNTARSPVFISSQNSTINSGLTNTVVIGGTTLTASNSNTVYLGNYVNINNAYTLPNVDGTNGQVLKTNGAGVVSWQTDTGGGGVNNLADLNDVAFITGTPIEGDILVYNGTEWEARELPLTFTVSGSGPSRSVTNRYLDSDGSGLFASPFILPDNATLKYMSAACGTTGTWTAEVHVNGTLVTGATVTVTAALKAYIKFTSVLSFSAGDEVQLYVNGTGVDRPRINAIFVSVP